MRFKSILYFSMITMSFTKLAAMQVIQKDTSYTVNSAFKKSKKKFKAIEIAKPKDFDNVTVCNAIVYKNIGERKLSLDAFINTNKNNPALILVHGGGWRSGDKSHMKPMAQYIASQGYSCFTIEYRLSDEAIYPNGIYDIKDAIKYIKHNAQKFHVDTTKVAILGCSSGAQMATLVGTTNQNLKFETSSIYKNTSTVQAIINLDGILAFKHPKSKEGTMANDWLGGTYEEKSEIWKEASALTHTDKNTPPILFINSQYERFHAGRDDMIQILNKHHIYNQVETFANSPHTFWLFHPWFHQTVTYITTFLDNIFKSN